MKLFGLLSVATLLGTVAAKDSFALVVDAVGSTINGQVIKIGPANVFDGNSLGLFTPGETIRWSVHGSEVRAEESARNNKFQAALFGPQGGPYQFVGLQEPSKAKIPAGFSNIYKAWNVGSKLTYTGEPGSFWATPVIGEVGNYTVVFTQFQPVGATEISLKVVF